MSVIFPKDKLRGIETCPNGHRYNTARTGDICDRCGARLEFPIDEMTAEEIRAHVSVNPKDYVCGWLVCIKGPNIGCDYIIKPGGNFVGSAKNIHIQILKDKRIDKKHMTIVYEPDNRETRIVPEGSTGMVYLNNGTVMKSVVLEPNSNIEIGESVFKFVPFCGELFCWEESEDED